MTVFFAILKATVPPFLAFCLVVAFEQFLYRTDRTFMPIWSIPLLFVTTLVGRLMWLCWQGMVPMEKLLLYGGPESTSLLVSIVAFSIIFTIFGVVLAWSAVKALARDWNTARLDRNFSIARSVFLAWGILWLVAFQASVFFKPIVQEKTLLSLLSGG